MKANQLQPNEYDSFYAQYINLAGADEIIAGLTSNLHAINDLLISIPEYKFDYSYAEGKWTIKELIVHLIDSERVFAYRALRFARRDPKELSGFEQDDYVIASQANSRTKADLIEEYVAVRKATLTLYNSMDEGMLKFIGTANNSPMSARALGFIIMGHERHHVNIIKDRYL
jgi:hypothetical protein